jgi:sugar/nucleoside kinase (ribokinase family)
VLGIGNTIIDTVMTMPAFPIDDKVWVDSKQRFVGGQGMNCAQDMALLGLHVSVMTRIGDDSDGKLVQRQFQEMGIDTCHCISIAGAQTMSACVVIGTTDQSRSCLMHKDQRLFEYDLSAHLKAVIADVESGFYDAVYTDGHQLDMVLPVAHAACKCGIPLIADIEILNDESRVLAGLASELIAPAKVICALSGQPDPGSAAVTLANLANQKTVIATAGSDGSYGARHGDAAAFHMPAHQGCNVRDTVGAGDAYHAGFIASSDRGHSTLEDRMGFATRVAAALCETPGPVVGPESLDRYGLRPAAHIPRGTEAPCAPTPARCTLLASAPTGKSPHYGSPMAPAGETTRCTLAIGEEHEAAGRTR